LTAERGEFVPETEVIAEIDSYLAAGPALDAITFSGSGEPTLSISIGNILAHIKRRYPAYRTIVITNGILLWKEEVRRDLAMADVVVPSLDAVSQDVFEKMLRPAEGVSSLLLIEGLQKFRNEYDGVMLLEVFIVPGINDGAELARIADAARLIKPDIVQINSIDRPGTEKWVERVDYERLAEIAGVFAPLKAEAVRGAKRVNGAAGDILATLRRRPSTIDDLRLLLNAEASELEAVIADLKANGLIISEKGLRGVYYRAV
jgi:wyosine [tRNA(Phe)-imidazoG37] synthetase (radical SAM superfamily)